MIKVLLYIACSFEEKVKESAKRPEHRNFSKVVKQHYTAPRENERYNKGANDYYLC